MLKEFKAFIMRPNILDLAIAFIMATFFAVVVATFIEGIVLPFIAAIAGKPSFDDLTFTVGDGVIRYGTFITAVVNFVIVGFVVFMIGRAAARAMPKEEEVTTKACPFCATDIPLAANRCPSCTSQLQGASA